MQFDDASPYAVSDLATRGGRHLHVPWWVAHAAASPRFWSQAGNGKPPGGEVGDEVSPWPIFNPLSSATNTAMPDSSALRAARGYASKRDLCQMLQVLSGSGEHRHEQPEWLGWGRNPTQSFTTLRSAD
jgi:hypothetical protein